jgi:DegV family protein with EDD domain
MNSVCILTDTSAQFTKPTFPGRNLVVTVPLKLEVNGQLITDARETRINSLPASASDGFVPKVTAPTVEEFRRLFVSLGQDYNEVIVILLSSHLNPAFDNAIEAADGVRGRVSVQVIDSQTTAVGLGALVQAAAEAASQGARSTEIERLLRGLIPHTYSVLCIPGMTYLYYSGFIGQAQALVGEMLGLLPIYTLEDGHLTPVEKAKNYRQLTDYLQEFIDEFSDLYHIALIQSVPGTVHDSRIFREHANLMFPKTPFSEHQINPPMALLFGPRTLAVFAMETPPERER